jgi:dipeptidyl aminopeptidase/acylaminoacyl peptidase
MTTTSAPVSTLHPARRGTRPITAEDLWTLPRLGAPQAFPNGQALVVPITRWNLEKNESRTQLYRVPVGGGAATSITTPDASASDPRVSPDGKQCGIHAQGRERQDAAHAHVARGGEPRKLTDLPLGVFDPRWLPDGSGLVFAATVIKGHFTPEQTAAELKRRADDPVKAHVTEERLYRYWDTWLTTGEVPHLFLYDFAQETARGPDARSDVWFDWMDPRASTTSAPMAARSRSPASRSTRSARWSCRASTPCP